MRNKYGRDKRKITSIKTSGSGTKDNLVKVSDLYPYLTWLETYVQSRETSRNITNIVSEEEEEDCNKEDSDLDDCASVDSSISVADSNISSVTGRTQYNRKRSR